MFIKTLSRSNIIDAGKPCKRTLDENGSHTRRSPSIGSHSPTESETFPSSLFTVFISFLVTWIPKFDLRFLENERKKVFQSLLLRLEYREKGQVALSAQTEFMIKD